MNHIKEVRKEVESFTFVKTTSEFIDQRMNDAEVHYYLHHFLQRIQNRECQD